jgi:hypothetical protein
VYALYCDGGSWAGNATKPVVAKPSSNAPARTIYYRGRLLLDALYDHLLGTGLSDASELLFAGCSAGGLTVYMHADYIAARMPETIKTVALADAMFSIDTPNAQGSMLAPEQFGWIFDRMNCSAYVRWLSRLSHHHHHVFSLCQRCSLLLTVHTLYTCKQTFHPKNRQFDHNLIPHSSSHRWVKGFGAMQESAVLRTR